MRNLHHSWSENPPAGNMSCMTSWIFFVTSRHRPYHQVFCSSGEHFIIKYSRPMIEFFLRHVVQERPRIDISVLCDFAENLCASLVIFERFQRTSTPHNVTLPRSWLLSWPKFIGTGNNTNTEPYIIFVDSMVALLRQVQTGLHAGRCGLTLRMRLLRLTSCHPDYLCLDNNILHDITTMADNVTNIFLARM